jgi:hypothetical protein
MPYIIKYNHNVENRECVIFLRGIFEDGHFWADIVNYTNRYNFDFADTFDNEQTRDIFVLIPQLITASKNIGILEGNWDCLIARYPMALQSILFKHYTDIQYDEQTQKHFLSLIQILNDKIEPIITSRLENFGKNPSFDPDEIRRAAYEKAMRKRKKK